MVIIAWSSLPARINTWLSTATMIPMAANLKKISTSNKIGVNDEIVYRIQIFTSDKELTKESKEYKGLYPIWKYRDGRLWK